MSYSFSDLKYYKEKYPHMKFHKSWVVTNTIANLLGQCEAYTRAICNTPMLPQHYLKALNVSLIKGAQATTAIEGNTLSEDEITSIGVGGKLPPSKEYQGQEVLNILEAYDKLRQEVVIKDKCSLVTPKLIMRFHKLVGKGLDKKYFNSELGVFRTEQRGVGGYVCPDPWDIEALIVIFCDYLKHQFKFDKDKEDYQNTIIQAIVAHVYLEWIHPFGDGNGRTGRLLEFYILLRGGFPDVASHILANYYNETRPIYYGQLDNATKQQSLTEFIEYALIGLRDGLQKALQNVQDSQQRITWERHVFEKFKGIKYHNKHVFKRRRDLILAFPDNVSLSREEIPEINTQIAKLYGGLNERTLIRDIAELLELKLLVKVGKDKYKANNKVVKGYVAMRRNGV